MYNVLGIRQYDRNARARTRWIITTLCVPCAQRDTGAKARMPTNVCQPATVRRQVFSGAVKLTHTKLHY